MFERNRRKGAALRLALDDLVRANGLDSNLRFIGDSCHFTVDLLDTGAIPPHYARPTCSRN